MIAISSHRPHGYSSCIYKKNQKRAIKSWEMYFDSIIYFGPFEKDLVTIKTSFIPCDGWPFIWQMAAEAGRQTSDYVAIINADIVVTQPFKQIEGIMKASKLQGASSRRRDYGTRQLLDDDRGRDIFICTPRVWAKVAKEIPRNCRIGHQQWDSWMVAFLRITLGSKYGDFTGVPCNYHPKHGQRNMPHAESIDLSGSRYDPKTTFRYDTQIVIDSLKASA